MIRKALVGIAGCFFIGAIFFTTKELECLWGLIFVATCMYLIR